MAIYHDRQRVLVRWSRLGEQSEEFYAARVIEVRSEYNERRRLLLQSLICVQYEVDGQRLWHPTAELSPLEEDTIMEERQCQEDSGVCVAPNPLWQALSLRCCYSFERLRDPARCTRCTHTTSCNYDSLQACLLSNRKCPVAGCAVELMRSREILRDDALRCAIAELPDTAESCWLRGRADVCLERPLEGAQFWSSRQSSLHLSPRSLGESEGEEGERYDRTEQAEKEQGEGEREEERGEEGQEEEEGKGEARERMQSIKEVEAQARAEGLVLLKSTNMTGYRHVVFALGKYRALSADGTTLGTFKTAAEAALKYSRHLGPDKCELQALQRAWQHAPIQTKLSLSAVKMQARAEGLSLLTCASKTGFVGVYQSESTGMFYAKISFKRENLGIFPTAAQAALHRARMLAAEEVNDEDEEGEHEGQEVELQVRPRRAVRDATDAAVQLSAVAEYRSKISLDLQGRLVAKRKRAFRGNCRDSGWRAVAGRWTR